MSAEANKDVARRFFAALSAMDLDGTEALMAPDHTFHFPLAPGPMTKEEHAAAQRGGLAAFSEYGVDIIEQIADDDRVVTRAPACTARCRPTSWVFRTPARASMFTSST